MFKDFQGVWTPVLLRRELRHKPVGLQIAGEPIALFRDAQGKATALLDRCPHRGVNLSLGQVTDEGRLACGFHGWEFDGDGQCARVPFNPEAKRSRFAIPAFPVHEAGGLIWLHTAPADGTEVEPPHVPEALRPAKSTLFNLETTWKTHWTRVMENMMDTAHVPYVHRRTIGRALSWRMHRETCMDVSWRPTANGFFITGIQDRQHYVGLHEFVRPNGMVLWVDGPPGRIRIHIFCIPVSPVRTRLLIVGHFGWTHFLSRLFVGLNRYVVQEDRALVESSQPPEAPHPSLENCVGTDRGTLQFRKYYHEVLKDKAPAGRSSLRLAEQSQGNTAS